MPSPKKLSPGDSPRDYVGVELRTAREQAGLTHQQLGDLIGYTGSYIGALERADRPPTPPALKAYDKYFKTDGRFSRMTELLKWEPFPGWFHAWLEIEQIARTLRNFQPLVMPGLLQTRAYARTILRCQRPDASSEEIEAQVDGRMRRQEILTRDNAPHLFAIIDEAVFMRPLGGHNVMAEQCEQLIEMAGRSNITVQVLPLELGMHRGLEGAFVIAELPDDPDVVYRDMLGEGQVNDDPAFVSMTREVWESLRDDALNRRASIEVVQKWANTWKNAG
jgi:transcriptional regulator with XRE-family HTH domain